VIFTKVGVMGEGVPGPHNHAKFRRFGFKNVGLEPPKSPKLVIFRIDLPISYAISKKFDLWEGVPGPHLRAKFHLCDLKNAGLQPPKW